MLSLQYVVLAVAAVLVGANGVSARPPAQTSSRSASSSRSRSSSWTHNWDTPASAWWGYGAMNTPALFTDAEVEFIATTYKVVLLSLCASQGDPISVSGGIMNVSRRLKAINPEIKVLQYNNMLEWACYPTTDPEYATFLANPSWWLRDDNGNVVKFGNSPVATTYDWTNPDAVAHFLTKPIIGADGMNLIDGFLFDGGAIYAPLPNISAARSEKLKLAMFHMEELMQQRLLAANGGLVLANGMIGGTVDPYTPTDPYNLDVLNYANGVENERGTPTFELVDRITGAFRLDAVAANLAAVENASQLQNGTKVVTMNYWAGPIIGFSQAPDNTRGFPIYAPHDPDNKIPNGTRADVVVGWQHILAKWLPFNLAMFLTVAGPSTYFTQMVWYASSQGFMSCPQAPTTCTAPVPFYPEMLKPLGPPTGPRVQLGVYKWVRHFEHAVVTLDLEDPFGPGTTIVWSA